MAVELTQESGGGDSEGVGSHGVCFHFLVSVCMISGFQKLTMYSSLFGSLTTWQV